MNRGSKLTLVNVGCGDRFHGDWINLDMQARRGVTQCNILNGLPFADGTVDAVYCAAMVEHLSFEAGLKFLLECNRVLKSRGIVRIAVPDFESQCRAYLQTLERLYRGDAAESDHDWMVLEIIDQFAREQSGGEMAKFLAKSPCNRDFIVSRIGIEGRDLIEMFREQQGKEASKSTKWFVGLARRILATAPGRWLTYLRIGHFRASGEVHRSAYDRFSLGRILSMAGFVEVTFPEHGKGIIPNWPLYRLELNDDHVIEKPDLLIAECRKP